MRHCCVDRGLELDGLLEGRTSLGTRAGKDRCTPGSETNVPIVT